MDWILGIALLAGFGPALLMMDWVMKNYTYPRVESPFFKDSTFFGMLVVGVIEGAVIFFAIIMLNILESNLNIILMVVVALIQLMAMVVVMNLRRFRGKSDSIFYGYGLGLGMAAGMAAGFTYRMCGLVLLKEAEQVSIDYTALIFYVVLMSFSMILILGACGTNVGEGIARHLPMQFVLQGAIPLVAYDMLFAAMWTSTGILYYVLLIVMLLLGAFYFRKCLFVNLPNIIRDVLKMNGEKRDDIPPSK